MVEPIAVFIPDEDAKKFLLFQKHYENISVLLDSGVFTIKNGSAVLHFDSSGTIQAVNRADVLFSRRHA